MSTSGEYVQLFRRDLAKCRFVELKVLGEHFHWNMGHPIREQERAIVAKGTVVEDLGYGEYKIFRVTISITLTNRNSVPSLFSSVAWIECGTPEGKYHKSSGPFNEQLISINLLVDDSIV